MAAPAATLRALHKGTKGASYDETTDPGAFLGDLVKETQGEIRWITSSPRRSIVWVHISHTLQLAALTCVAVVARMHSQSITDTLLALPVSPVGVATACFVAILVLGLVLLKAKPATSPEDTHFVAAYHDEVTYTSFGRDAELGAQTHKGKSKDREQEQEHEHETLTAAASNATDASGDRVPEPHYAESDVCVGAPSSVNQTRISNYGRGHGPQTAASGNKLGAMFRFGGARPQLHQQRKPRASVTVVVEGSSSDYKEPRANAGAGEVTDDTLSLATAAPVTQPLPQPQLQPQPQPTHHPQDDHDLEPISIPPLTPRWIHNHNIVKPVAWVLVCTPFTIVMSALDHEWFWVVGFSAAAVASLLFLITWTITETVNHKTAMRFQARLQRSAPRSHLHLNLSKHLQVALVVMVSTIVFVALLEITLYEVNVLQLAHVVLSSVVFLVWMSVCMRDTIRMQAAAKRLYFSRPHDNVEFAVSIMYPQTMCGLGPLLRWLLEDLHRAKSRKSMA